MAENKFNNEETIARCVPMGRLQSVIGGKWKILILWYVSFYKVQRDSRDMLTRRFAFVLIVVSCNLWEFIFHTDSASRGRGMSRSMPSWSAGRG